MFYNDQEKKLQKQDLQIRDLQKNLANMLEKLEVLQKSTNENKRIIRVCKYCNTENLSPERLRAENCIRNRNQLVLI